MNARAGFLARRPDALSSTNLRALAGPLLICMILGMMILPLPPFLLDLLFTFNIALSVMVLLVSMYTMKPLDFAAFPSVLLFSTLAAAVAERRVDAGRAARRPHRSGRGRPGDRVVRPLPGRRQLRGRHRRVRDPDRDQLHRHHQGRGADRGSVRALHARRDARQADGDRRRPERRPDQRRAGPQAARGSRAGSRVLRLDGRREQVRARRCDRRPADHGDQHRRRADHRDGPARHGLRRGGQELHAADDRRRPRRADSVAGDFDRRRRDRLARRDQRGHRHAADRPAVHAIRAC